MMFHKIQILVLSSIIFITHYCNAQAELDFPDNSIDSLSPQPGSSPSTRSLRICNTKDSFSRSYCTCTNQVVSCDFANYTVEYTNSTDIEFTNVTNTDNDNANQSDTLKNDHLELSLYGYQFPPTTSRICICNTPPNLHLTFSREHFLPLIDAYKIQRFDLFNLSGITHFMGGFNLNFHGDLYIANVSQIPIIHGLEFGRGVDDPIQDVQNQECCSPIKLDQSHKKPLLLIENSTVGHVETRGLSDDHLWKTIILKSSVFKKVDTEAIIFTSNEGLNAAIIDCTFENVLFNGIIFQNTANVFLSGNIFRNSNSSTVHSDFLMARSSLNTSNILLLKNIFWNEMYMDLDARHIVSWYNRFDLWDNYTFERMKLSSFSPSSSLEGDLTGAHNRSVSFRYNLIKWVEMQGKPIDFGNGSTVTLTDNVLSDCNCSTSTLLLTDKGIKPDLNWCYTKRISSKNGKCFLKLDAVIKHCNGSLSEDFEKLCEDKSVSTSKVPDVGTNLTLEIREMHIKSDFVSKIVDEFHWVFEAHVVSRLVKAKGTYSEGMNKDAHADGEMSDRDKDSNSISSNNATIPVVIIIVVVFVLAVSIVIYRYKHRFLRRFGHQELIGSRNELI